MRYCALNKYLSSHPALLISRDTSVASMNPAARHIGILSAGDRLSSLLAPIDLLKFEAASKSLFTVPPLLFSISAVAGFSYAAAYFEEIIGHRFALTVLYKSREECIADTENEDLTPCAELPLINSLIRDIMGIGDDGFFMPDRPGAFPMYDITQKILSDIESRNSFFDCDLIFDDAAPENPFFNCVGLDNYIKTLSLMLFAANDLSCDRKVSVTRSFSSDSSVICMKTNTNRLPFPVPDTESMANAHPALSSALSLCEYCAGCCGMEFFAECSPDSVVTLTLRKDTRRLPETDFKCPAGLPEVEQYYGSVCSMLDFLRSPDKQQQYEHEN